MPCYDPPYNPAWDELQRSENEWRESAIDLRKRYERVTQILCDIFTKNSDIDCLHITEDGEKWWKEHQEYDRPKEEAHRNYEQIQKEWDSGPSSLVKPATSDISPPDTVTLEVKT